MHTMTVVISGAVEGDGDKVVLYSLIRAVGGELGTIYVKQGKENLKRHIDSYNSAAKHQPWCVAGLGSGCHLCI